MTFIEAIKVLGLSKGDIMEFAYGRNHRGIDSAIPQYWADIQGLSYNGTLGINDLFWYCADCRHSITNIVYMADMIRDEIKSAIILKAYYCKLYLAGFISDRPAIENHYINVDSILESLKFDYTEDK
jgi:hypothetical protein